MQKTGPTISMSLKSIVLHFPVVKGNHPEKLKLFIFRNETYLNVIKQQTYNYAFGRLMHKTCLMYYVLI